jgi:hypothetical protein
MVNVLLELLLTTTPLAVHVPFTVVALGKEFEMAPVVVLLTI